MSFIIRNIEMNDIPKLLKFICGNISMECFLKSEAYIHHISGEGITKEVLEEETDQIIAYYTLKTDAVKIIDEEMHLIPRYIPCIEIARIAILSHWQNGSKGIHLGTHLVGQIIGFIKDIIAAQVGCRFITIHAIHDKVPWYKKEFAFEELEDGKYGDNEDTTYMCLDLLDESLLNEYAEYKKLTQ